MGKSVSYALSMNSESYEYVTIAVAVYSIERKRFLSFGQCVPFWLEQWREGSFPKIDLAGFRSVWVLGKGETRVAQLYLTGDSADTLKHVRDELHALLKCRKSTAMAVAGLAYAIVTTAQKSGHIGLLQTP